MKKYIEYSVQYVVIKNSIYLENICNDDCLIVNFKDVIDYHKQENKKEQLKNVKIALNEFKFYGLSNQEIEIELKKYYIVTKKILNKK